MIDSVHLAMFVGASLLLLITPGPAVLYIVTRSLEQGRIAGLISVLGVCSGTLVHVVAAALGLSALLVSSARAFDVVRMAGAAYLIALGVHALVHRDEGPRNVDAKSNSSRRAYFEGVFVNLLNPHTALFCFAFLPQFVDKSGPPPALQMTGFGLLYVALSLVTDSIWAVAAGTAGTWVRQRPWFTRGQRYVTAGALIGLGTAAALTGSRRR